MQDHVRHIAVDKYLPGRKPHNLVGRYAAIGTAYPEIFWALLGRELFEERRIFGLHFLRPQAIFLEQLLESAHVPP